MRWFFKGDWSKKTLDVLDQFTHQPVRLKPVEIRTGGAIFETIEYGVQPALALLALNGRESDGIAPKAGLPIDQDYRDDRHQTTAARGLVVGGVLQSEIDKEFPVPEKA